MRRSDPIEAALDADNALVLGEALAGEAEIFVTSDAVLLELGSAEGVLVVSPRRFLGDLRSIER